MMTRTFRVALVCATALTSFTALAEPPAVPAAAASDRSSAPLEQQFQEPPNTARPRVWWHWMNGNVTKDGIAKDLAWMKRVGIGGMQNFDANLRTPQIVDKRLIYMTPEWQDAFRFAASEADRLDLELAIASSPGWSETGGPWVPSQDGLKKVVWSETRVSGGKHFASKLAAPPQVTGPYQSIASDGAGSAMLGDTEKPKTPDPYYADIAVLAIPEQAVAPLAAPSAVTGTDGKRVDGAVLTDADWASGVELVEVPGTAPRLEVAFAREQTVRSVTLFLPGAVSQFTGAPYLPKLEASDDGKAWRAVADLPLGTVPVTVGLAPVTARRFRVVFMPARATGFSFTAQVPGVDLMGIAVSTGMAGLGGGKAYKVTEFRLNGEDRIDRAEAKAGFSLAQDYYALAGNLPEVAGIAPGKVIDITGKMRVDGTLEWTPPKGQWRLLRFGYSLLGTINHPATAEATGLEVDKFDGPAVRRYLEHYLGMYKTASGGLIGDRGVRALLTDSIEVGAANWTPQMIAQFRRLRGYDPTRWLPALAGIVIDSRADSERFLYDFRRTLADLMASEHYGTIATVAHEHGLKVYGEALEDHRPSLGDDMAMRKYSDVPMAALWTYRREEGPKPSYLADMKGAASVAHIYGQNLVAAESMTALMAPWAFAPNDLKRVIDLAFVTGVNRPVVHTSIHVPVDDKQPGLSLFIFGQYFNRQETWAELARPWVDYIARNSFMLQQGRNVADVGYFYGEEAPLTGLYGDKAVADAPIVYAYDFVNADALSAALQNDGGDLVAPGGARYRALYLGGSSRKMTLATLRKLAELVEGGATVIGLKPEGNPGLTDAAEAAVWSALAATLWSADPVTRVGRGQVLASTDVEASLASIGITPDFRYTGGGEGADIPFVHRQLSDGESYFLVNRKDRTETIEAYFRVTGKAPELWDAQTGQTRSISYRIEDGVTVVPLTLAVDDSVHIVFRKPANAQSLTAPAATKTTLAQIEGPWSVAFQTGRGAPATVQLAKLAPLDESAEPGIRYFSGVATYTRDISAPAGWNKGEPLWLDLGEVRDLAEILVNGKSAGHVWRAPYRLNIGAMMKAGRNRIDVRVANLWVNRLIGDAQPGAGQKVTWTSMPTYTAQAPLRRSGLIGPVKLVGENGGAGR